MGIKVWGGGGARAPSAPVLPPPLIMHFTVDALIHLSDVYCHNKGLNIANVMTFDPSISDVQSCYNMDLLASLSSALQYQTSTMQKYLNAVIVPITHIQYSTSVYC